MTTGSTIPGQPIVWANIVPGVDPGLNGGCSNLVPKEAGKDRILNIAAFSQPTVPDSAGVGPYAFGNARVLPHTRACAYLNENLELQKKFPITERWAFNFGVMANNALNRHWFQQFNTNISSPGNFGTPNASTNGRWIQFWGRLEF